MQTLFGQGRQHNISWQQALCSHLVFVLEPQRSLSDVLRQFIAEDSCQSLAKVGQKGEEDLLFVLLRLYVGDNQAGPEHAATKLRSFHNIQVTKETSRTQEFEMQWLVQYVLRLYSSFEAGLVEDMKAGNLGIQPAGSDILLHGNRPGHCGVLERIGVIEVHDFDKTCSNYINQLLR